MAFDNSEPLLPLSRCLYPWGGSRGPMVLRSWELPWVIGPPASPTYNAGLNRAPCVGQRQAGWPQGLLISNSSHGAGPLKRSSNNDCVMIWKRQQNLSSATKRQHRKGKPCPNSLGFLYVSLFFFCRHSHFWSDWCFSVREVLRTWQAQYVRCAIGRWKYPNPTGPLIMYSTQITQSSIHLPHK